MASGADVIVQGILLGGLYALFAMGLSLVFGVMRLVNLAHGDFIVAAAFAAFCVVSVLPIHPFLAIAAVVPFMAGLGYLIQLGLFNRLLGKDPLRPLLVTFGVSVVLQNALLMTFSADTRRLSAGSIETQSVDVGSVTIGVYPAVVFAMALAVTMALQWIFYSTALGQRLRATSDDPEIVGLVGVDHLRVFAIASAIAFAVIGIAGVLMAIRGNFDPFMGPARLLVAFEAVIIGGLGNFWGTLVGGIVIGLAQSIGAAIDPAYQTIAGHIVFFAVLLLRPDGLFPKVAHQ
ncbi:branched-chain amino acid transport system permease protein [Mesorhizobium albiziae]|uniref:Branched-chain amino acid transport system permease protein n=1 Tax=Neomesorhizobium albiziae TaxID=335020 RepID=A0A1I4ETY8_9HYPH|nr:branched-chain amino acid ABC transporter permease [Mesorhizobium albiziae]GLS32676.1 branched-chain amino acid ABC transporter permease [Mesorhizobium albiziae]SFL09178.1 branched-chain amino acid transport system permease protein [Mesorhizobium albiziae]